MADYRIEGTVLTDLADVIRHKTNTTEAMTVAAMTETLNDCKIWGLEAVSGSVTLTDANMKTLTIPNLPFSEIYMVFISRCRTMPCLRICLIFALVGLQWVICQALGIEKNWVKNMMLHGPIPR